MNEYEIDEACKHVLQSLRDLNPSLARQLTAELKGAKYKGLSKREVKIQKVRLLYQRNLSLFQEIFAPVNAAYFRERSSPTNFFELLENQIQPLNPAGELTGGNYRAKT